MQYFEILQYLLNYFVMLQYQSIAILCNSITIQYYWNHPWPMYHHETNTDSALFSRLSYCTHISSHELITGHNTPQLCRTPYITTLQYSVSLCIYYTISLIIILLNNILVMLLLFPRVKNLRHDYIITISPHTQNFLASLSYINTT